MRDGLEIWEHWHAGDSLRALERNVGVDRHTLRKYGRGPRWCGRLAWIVPCQRQTGTGRRQQVQSQLDPQELRRYTSRSPNPMACPLLPTLVHGVGWAIIRNKTAPAIAVPATTTQADPPSRGATSVKPRRARHVRQATAASEAIQPPSAAIGRSPCARPPGRRVVRRTGLATAGPRKAWRWVVRPLGKVSQGHCIPHSAAFAHRDDRVGSAARRSGRHAGRGAGITRDTPTCVAPWAEERASDPTKREVT